MSSTVFRLASHRFYCHVGFHFLPEALRKNISGKDVIYRLPSPVSRLTGFRLFIDFCPVRINFGMNYPYRRQIGIIENQEGRICRPRAN